MSSGSNQTSGSGGGQQAAACTASTASNAPGISANAITTGNVSDLSGPVPGLFQGAVYGVDAYYAYINSQGGVCGRQLKMLSADSQTDCTANQNAHTNLMPKVFAFVGSFSLYDDCGTQIMEQHPTVPDLSYALGLGTKKNTVNNFPPQVAPPGYPDGMFCYYKNLFGGATSKAGAIYGNLPASAFSERMIENSAVSGCGWHFTDSIPVGETQTTFSAEIAKLQSDGVKVVFEVATTQANIAEMKREADNSGYHPIWVVPVAYASDFLTLLGSPQQAEGMYGYNLYSLFFSSADAHNIAEVGLFQKWMNITHPGAALDLFAMYSWAAAKLFVQEMQAIGGNPTQAAFMNAIRSVHSYDGGGIVNQSDVGAHKPSNCYLMWRIHAGEFVRFDTPAATYRCDGQFVPYNGS